LGGSHFKGDLSLLGVPPLIIAIGVYKSGVDINDLVHHPINRWPSGYICLKKSKKKKNSLFWGGMVKKPRQKAGILIIGPGTN